LLNQKNGKKCRQGQNIEMEKTTTGNDTEWKNRRLRQKVEWNQHGMEVLLIARNYRDICNCMKVFIFRVILLLYIQFTIQMLTINPTIKGSPRQDLNYGVRRDLSIVSYL
jgi:hypothetical protein